MIKHSGFTLVELMVTLAVAAIVLTIAVPGFQNLVRNNRIATQTNELVGSLQLARSEAVKRSTNVTICTSTNGSSCTNSAWQQGWIVLVGGTILRANEALGGVTVESGGVQSLQYQGTGRTTTTGVNFDLCHAQAGANGRRVNIATTGRVSVEPLTCSS
jgi:type IV fimbrial biogenesis protein FimT